MPEPLKQSQRRPVQKHRATLLIFLLLCTSGFLVFYPALFNFFCADDFMWIKTTNDIFTRNDLTSSDSFALLRGRPVLNLVFFFLYQFSHLKPFSYHLLSIILHIFNALLIFRLLSFVTDRITLRFAGSLIFLVHFIHEETLFWISSLSSLLCCTFYLSGLLFFLKWRSNRRKWILYPLSLSFCLLALFSREDAITFPLLIFLIVLFDFPPVQRLNKLKVLKISSPFFISSGFYLLLRASTLPLAVINHSYKANLIIPFKNIGYFLVNLIFPYRFLFDFIGYHRLEKLQIYYQSLTPHWLTIPLFLALLFFLFKVFSHYLKKKDKMLNSGLAFVLLSILPYLFLNGNGQRFLYFPVIGFSVLSVYFISSIASQLASKRQFRVQNFVYSLMIVIFLLNFIIIRQRSHWWREAGLTAESTIQQIETLVPSAQESELYFINLPTRIHGAYIFLNGFEEAISLYYPEIEGKIKHLGKIDPAKLDEPESRNLYTFKNGKLVKL